MRFLRQNTAIRLTVGPFFDKTDGITPEVALTVTNCKLTLMVDDGNVPTLVLDAAATASAGNNDMVHVTNDDAGFYDLELTAAQLNYVGRAMLAITDAANHCPVFHEFMIIPAKIYDSLILGTDNIEADAIQILGTAISAPATAGILDVNLKNIANAAVSTTTAQLGVNAVQISGDATAADNEEAFFDGTGYAGGTIKLTVDLVSILGTALTETAGYLAAGFKKFFNIETPVLTIASVNQTGDAYAKVDTEIGTIDTKIDTIDSNVDAIKAKTDMQPTVWYSA